MERSATAIWMGNLTEGKGTISTQSGVLKNTHYGFNTRFEEGHPGTNPEELIAAALSGCFTMALSKELTDAGITVGNLHTDAIVTLNKTADGFAIPEIALHLVAKLIGAEKEVLEKLANKTKENCPVAKLLNAEISLTVNMSDV